MDVRWGWFKLCEGWFKPIPRTDEEDVLVSGGDRQLASATAILSSNSRALTSLGCSVIGFNSSYLTIGGPQDDLESRDFHRAAATTGLDHLGWAGATTGRREEMALKPRDGMRAAMTGLETIWRAAARPRREELAAKDMTKELRLLVML
jgi:hypothetical protein